MRVLIVDDEPLARSHLERLCALHSDLDVIAQAESGAAAIDAIHCHQPDVVLLDVELNDMSGFEVLQSLDRGKEPLAIMVTGHPEHALKAFETQAVDYLTKPVDADRFGAAIERARLRRPDALLSSLVDEIARELRTTLESGAEGGARPRQLICERAHRLYFVEAATVDYIESDGNYVTIHARGDCYINRNSLKHLAPVLAPLGFRRIERSLLVNLNRVEFAEKLDYGKFAFILRSGCRLLSSAKYRGAILREIRQGQLSGLEGAH